MQKTKDPFFKLISKIRADVRKNKSTFLKDNFRNLVKTAKIIARCNNLGYFVYKDIYGLFITDNLILFDEYRKSAKKKRVCPVAGGSYGVTSYEYTDCDTCLFLKECLKTYLKHHPETKDFV